MRRSSVMVHSQETDGGGVAQVRAGSDALFWLRCAGRRLRRCPRRRRRSSRRRRRRHRRPTNDPPLRGASPVPSV